MTIEFRAVHKNKNKAWRRVNTHHNINNAINGEHGAKNLILRRGEVANRWKSHGDVIAVFVWDTDAENGYALRLAPGTSDKVDSINVNKSKLEFLDANEGIEIDKIDLFFSELEISKNDVNQALVTDMECIFNDHEFKETERTSLIKARIGQGEFRNNVQATWKQGEVCAVTGVNIREMLIASHINAWKDCSSNSERLDGANGILLCAHIDKLFDKHLITFINKNNEYYLEINPKLDKQALKQIGIKHDTKLDTSQIGFNDFIRFEEYMRLHSKIFYELKQHSTSI